MDSPQKRVIMLGASNVVLSLAVVVETACRAWGRPLDILAAIGHGRSFGMTSSVLGRTLPGILQCDLWDEWRTRDRCPTAALITDIGNDIFFGASPPQIASWVRQCLERLADHCDRIIITELPLESVSTVGPRRFLLLRSVLFPRSKIGWHQALNNACELNGQVVALAKEFGATAIKPQSSWYGLDRIHIRGRHRAEAWRQILAHWGLGASSSTSQRSLRQTLHCWLARPKYRMVFGIEQRRIQPARRFADGTRVSLY